MSLAGLPSNDGLESKWISFARSRFFELSKVAVTTLPVSPTYCFAGMDPADFYNLTYGNSVALQSTLHEIYLQHGPLDLLLRGCDADGKWYFKCAKHKYAPAKAVICVSTTKGGTAAAASIEPRQPVVDGTVPDSEDWEELVSDVQVVEDDWVKV